MVNIFFTAYGDESGAKWDLTSNELRPKYWTSADAAGLPIFPGLVNYDNIYILEGATIYVYSLKDYKLIKKFGKAGEGPKEFK